MFARTTESGVYSHGVNRFPRFIQQLDNGDIIPDAKPQRVTSLGAIEQWDAQRAIGNLTAKKMMTGPSSWLPIMVLARWRYVMLTTGCAAAATAGRRRKKAISAFAGPLHRRHAAVGAKECRIGTNPLIVAIPSTPITMVDMSMSMFSYGMLEVNRLAGRELPVDGGFDDNGQLTKEPGVIEKNRRILPMGYWKGSGLSIVLDMIATLLSNGSSVAEVTRKTAMSMASHRFSSP